MRNVSLLGVIIALVLAGFLMKRQLSAVRMTGSQPVHTDKATNANTGSAAVEQVQDAMDEIMRRHQADLERADDLVAH